jgi:hypothetical protein
LWQKATTLVCVVLAGLAGFSALAAGPEPGVPPRPFFPDYFSGTVLVQGKAPPTGVQLLACVDDCDTVFASPAVPVGELGSFSGLAVGPKDEALVGHVVRFYLTNEYGRITASETVRFSGALELRRLDLTFRHPLPGPATGPALPAVGDWMVPVIPGLALAAGMALILAGGWLLVASQRRNFWWARFREQAQRPQPVRVLEVGESEAPR